MTENSESEPDVATQLRDIGKKYMRFISLSLDSVIKDLEPRARAKKFPKAKQIDTSKVEANPKPKPRNLGIARWLRGSEAEDRKE